MHIHFLLEEPSAEAFLQGMLGKLLLPESTWDFIVFQGKRDLMANLTPRLKAYRKWIPEDFKIVVLIDEDRSDCKQLKAQMEAAAAAARLPTKSNPAKGAFVVLNRIAVEELEAWYFGDPAALRAAFPGVPPTLAAKAPFRDPDAIAGGTWETLERTLRKAGHFKGGLGKIEAAREMAKHMNPQGNRSVSFGHFVKGLAALGSATA